MCLSSTGPTYAAQNEEAKDGVSSVGAAQQWRCICRHCNEVGYKFVFASNPLCFGDQSLSSTSSGYFKMRSSLFTWATFAVAASASWEGNLNYRSPSHDHAFLGLDVPKIQKRQSLQARQAPANFTDSQLNFTHGVASGDPYDHSVILWTRLAPSLASDSSNVTVSGYVPYYRHEREEYIRISRHRVCLTWKIANDANMTRVADQGTAYTTSDIDFTVKV